MSVLAISLPVVGCFVGLVLAIELLDWGMRGRRVGDALHCRGCDYNLTGLQSDRCPECAALLNKKTIAIGARQRRRGAIAISTLILVGSSGWLGWMGYQEVRQFDRYRFYSAARLLEMADRDDLRALVEMEHRLRADTVPESLINELIVKSLDKQGAWDPITANVGRWATLLGLLDKAGRISDHERLRLFEQALLFNVRTRERIWEGDHPVVRIEIRDRGSREIRGEFYWRELDIRVDGESGAVVPLSTWQPMWGRSGPSFTRVHRVCRGFKPEPGIHTVEVVVEWGLFGRTADPRSSEPYYLWQETLAAEFTVVPGDEPDPIRFVQDDAIAASLTESIVTVGNQETKEDGSVQHQEVFFFVFPGSLIALACDVILLSNEEEHSLGLASVPKGIGGLLTPDRTGRRYPTEYALPPEFTLELRPSREAAAQTFDSYEFLDAVIRLGPFEMIPSKE